MKIKNQKEEGPYLDLNSNTTKTATLPIHSMAIAATDFPQQKNVLYSTIIGHGVFYSIKFSANFDLFYMYMYLEF